MNSHSAISKAVRIGLLAGAGVTLGAPVGLAQAASQSGQAANQNTTSANVVHQLGKVQVTGTRILRTSTETAQPITIITAKQIKQTGLVTIGAVLENLTQSGNSISDNVNGSGRENIDLRYFGSKRVLVLVNGRRWTTGIDGTVDISAIPSAIIDHIEILQDGASAIYGSDAITGVVNIITVKNFNGAQASAYMGIYHNTYQGFDHWDGKQQSYNFTVGTSGERGSVVMSASYTEQNAIQSGARAQTADQVWDEPPMSNLTPAGDFIVQSPAFANQQVGQAACNAQGVCNMTLIKTPEFTPTLDNFRDFTSSDLFNFAPYNQLLPPIEQKTLYMAGHYDIADNLTFTSMGQIAVRTADEILTPPPLLMGEAGIATFNNQTFGIGANNPYNPFHKDLAGTASQYCPSGQTAQGTPCEPNILLQTLNLQPNDSGPRNFKFHVDTYTFRMGLNGFFNALGSEWDWNVGAGYGNVYNTQLSTGNFDTVNLAQALDAPGAAQCNGPGQSTKPAGDSVEVDGSYYPILIPGCVPVNFFGGYNIHTGQGGTLTPQMLNYVQYENHHITSNTMRDYTANITGNLFELPAGPLAVAVGTEYLEQDSFDHPDALSVAGNVDEGQSKNTQGKIKTDAEYVEFNVPLLSDAPFAKSVSLDVANRWSQFKWIGGNPQSVGYNVLHKTNATTAQAKLRWEVTRDLLLRGSWSQGFRVPNLSELYTGTAVNFPTINDPCAPSTHFGSWTPGTPLPPGCGGAQHVQTNYQIETQVGGNPALSPEHAVSKSVGFVYNPEWLPGFDISADYYKIDVLNIISQVSPQFIMAECYVAQDPQYCSKITTVNGGTTITSISDLNANTGEKYSRGVDVSAHYRLPPTSIGNFKIGTNWTFVQSFVNVFSSTSSPTGFQSQEDRGLAIQGETAIPKDKGNVTLNWDRGNWSAAWQVRYIGKMFERCSTTMITLGQCSQPNSSFPLGGSLSQGKNQLGTTIYHDVEGTYHVDSIDTDLTFGIRNLFDKQYPAALNYTRNRIDSVGYDIIPGRFFYANISVKF